MYFHFVDFEKAFDSVHRDSLWRIMRVYGIPDKLIGLVKVLYNGFTCTVIDEGETTEGFLSKKNKILKFPSCAVKIISRVRGI